MAKINIFKSEWIDMVFEGRNKKYGAYQLRSESPKTTAKALGLGIIIFSFAVATPMISKWVGDGLSDGDKAEEEVKLVEMVELPPPPVEELPPPPPVVMQKEAPKNIVEEVKFKPLEAVKKEDVPKDPPNIKDFEDKEPGKEDQKASPTGAISIEGEAGKADSGADEPVDDNKLYGTMGLQVQPSFPGSFQNEFIKQFRQPEIDKDLDIRIYVTFVVEKDGSISNVKCPRDPGYGIAKEAERAVKAIKKKWEPGIQNGKPVRVTYSLPIVLKMKS
jgi:protein TonB